MVSVEGFGASFRIPFEAVFGGVAVCPLKASSNRFLGCGVTLVLAKASICPLASVSGLGEEESNFEFVTGGNGVP